MALREFLDSAGQVWQVWDTHPANDVGPQTQSALSRYMAAQPDNQAIQGAGVRNEFRNGWLTFASGAEKRRLAPIPAEWDGADKATMQSLLEAAREALTKPDSGAPESAG